MSSETKDETFKVKTLNLFTEELVGLFNSRGLTIIQCSEHIDKLQSTIATQSTRIAELERELSDANNEAASLGQLNGELKAEVERLQSQSPLPEGAVVFVPVIEDGKHVTRSAVNGEVYRCVDNSYVTCRVGSTVGRYPIYRQLTPEETSRLSPERQSGEEYSEPIGDREGTYWHHDNRIEWRSGKGTEADCERIQVATFVNYQRAGEFWHKWNEHKHKAEYMAEAIRERDKFKAEAERQSGSDDYAHLSRHCKRLAEHCKVPKRATENPFEQLGDVEHAVNQLRADLAEAKAQLSTAVQVKEGDYIVREAGRNCPPKAGQRFVIPRDPSSWHLAASNYEADYPVVYDVIEVPPPSAPKGTGESDDGSVMIDGMKCTPVPAEQVGTFTFADSPPEPSPAGTEGAVLRFGRLRLVRCQFDWFGDTNNVRVAGHFYRDEYANEFRSFLSRLKAENETLKGLLRECKLPIELFRNHGQWSVPFRENLDQLLDAIDSALAPTAEAKNV